MKDWLNYVKRFFDTLLVFSQLILLGVIIVLPWLGTMDVLHHILERWLS